MFEVVINVLKSIMKLELMWYLKKNVNKKINWRLELNSAVNKQNPHKIMVCQRGEDDFIYK